MSAPARMGRAEAPSPRVEGAGQVAHVAENVGQQIVCVGKTRIFAHAAARHLAGRVELAAPAQRFGQVEKRQAQGSSASRAVRARMSSDTVTLQLFHDRLH